LRVRVEHSALPETALVTLTSAESLQVRLSPNALSSVHDLIDIMHCLGKKATAVRSSDSTGQLGKEEQAAVQSLFALENCTGLALACHRSMEDIGNADIARMDLSPLAMMQPLSIAPRKELVHLPDMARKVWPQTCRLDRTQSYRWACNRL
jgi:hypothetical protein